MDGMGLPGIGELWPTHSQCRHLAFGEHPLGKRWVSSPDSLDFQAPRTQIQGLAIVRTHHHLQHKGLGSILVMAIGPAAQ